MKVVFVGAVEFSRHCLEEIAACDGDIAAVYTLDPTLAKRHADYVDLGITAGKLGIPVRYVRDLNEPEHVEAIRALKPDLICVFGWSRMVEEAIREIPPQGCLGSHSALLPKRRGRHPLIWALVEGLTESGLTFFYLDDGADSGDILWQRSFPITLENDAGAVYAKMIKLAREGIREFWPKLERGMALRTPQDHTAATYCRKRGEADGEIHWAVETLCTYNLIRALTHPYVGAHTYYQGRRISIWRSELLKESLSVEADKAVPGTVLACVNGRIHVRTGDGRLCLKDQALFEELRPGQRLGRDA